MADTLRNIVVGTAGYGFAGAEKAIGRDRIAGIGRWIGKAYRDQPLLLGLVLTCAAFVAVPIVAFAGYAALWAAIAFGVFWAIFLFWAGLGLLVFLVPAVCIATGLGIVAFAWAAVAYYLVGAWVLALFGYESLDDALGVSAAAPPTNGASLRPHAPAYPAKSVDVALDGKHKPAHAVADEVPKAGEPEGF